MGSSYSAGKIARKPEYSHFLPAWCCGGASNCAEFGDRVEKMEGVQEEQLQAHVLGKKGGTRLFPVIIANEVAERIVSSSVAANLIIYLTTKYHLGAETSAIIILLYTAAANFLPVCGAIVSDALLGRYLMVTLTLFSCTIGTTLLCLTSVIPHLTPSELDCILPKQQGCTSATPIQLLVLCTSLGFMALGASGVRPCCLAFAEDQIAHWNTTKKDRALRNLFSWYYASVGFSQIVAVTVLVYFQDRMGWKVGFLVSAAIMASVTLVNLAASPFYVKVKPQKSMWAGLLKVVVMSLMTIKNRDLVLPEANHGAQFHTLPGSTQLVPSERMRFLNKACMVRLRPGNEDPHNTSSRSTCTVEQVENLKSALSVMPMCSAMVMSFLLQSSSFGVLQAATMDRRIGTTRFQIPAGSISIFEIMTFTVWSGCYDSYILPVLRRISGRQRVLTLKQRMGIGTFLAVASMAVASVVETRRREAAAAARTPMSAMWLAPQYVLMGLSGAFGAIAQIEFYYAVLPKSMGSFVLALLFFASAVASVMATAIVKLVNVVTGGDGRRAPWISDDLNQGRYDLYYRLLAVLGAVDLVYLVICAHVFHETTQNRSLEAGGADGETEEFRGLAHRSM